MRGVLCSAFDGIKALTIGEAEEPRPGADEVLIDVHAASVSYMDYLMASGGYQMRPPLPYVPGTDAAGIVVAVGEQVDRFRPGDRVACEGWCGAFAERMTAKASITAHLPDSVDFITGSTLLHMYLTAHYALIIARRSNPAKRSSSPARPAAWGWRAWRSLGSWTRASSPRLEAPPKRKSSATMALMRSSTIPVRTYGSA
jgi:NADPH:quinone reductase-like Zn-dependent oxidoreductase